MLTLAKLLAGTRRSCGSKLLQVSPMLARYSTNDKKPVEVNPPTKPAKPPAKSAKPTDKEKKPAPPPKQKLTDLEKLRKLQAHFQEDDDIPIFLKGGAKDQLLYRTTVALCVLGVLLQIKLFIELILK